MKISKRDLRRLIIEGVIDEKRKKKKARTAPNEDPPESMEDSPSDPALASKSETETFALELLSKAIVAHNKRDNNTRDKKLKLMRSIIAPPPDGLPKKYASVAKHIKNKAKVEMEIDIDFNGKVAPTPQVQAQKRKSNPKIAYIQKVVSAPSSNGGKKLGDGMWGGKTTTAWEKWISSPATLEKIKALIATDSLDESKFLNLDLLFEGSPSPAVSSRVSDDTAGFIAKNKGNAAEIAKHMGYSPSLAGVHDLITALEAGHRRDTSLGIDSLDGPDADADADDALATHKDARRMADEWDTMSDDEKREAFEAQALANARDPEFDWAGEMDIRDEEDASEEEDDVPQSDAEILAQSPGDLEESHSHGWLIRNRYRRY